MESASFLADLLIGHEPVRRRPARDSILECGRPLPLWFRAGPTESGRGLPHSKTSRSPAGSWEAMRCGWPCGPSRAPAASLGMHWFRAAS